MKIAIANDLRLAAELLNDLIQRRTPHKVIWTACDGEDAVKKCTYSKPDILLMDLVMPKMNGAEATKEIMKKTPCAILLVTANVEKNTSLVFEAMGSGALDVVKTPSFDMNTHEAENDDLLQKINNIVLLMEYEGMQKTYSPPSPSFSLLPGKSLPPLLVIGASTGGPTALRKILSQLHKNIPYSVVIVQHIDPEFAGSLVSWLQEKTELKVHLINENTLPKAGEVYVAGKKAHLVLNSSMQLSYLPDDQRDTSLHKPSINVFFESIAKTKGTKGMACLLTGMGTDGAKGLLALKNSGFETIVEDASSAVVYSMPKAALQLDAAEHVIPLDLIGKKIIDYFRELNV